MAARRDGLEEAGLLVTSGGAGRNPRWGDGCSCRPRRGRYARGGRWHRRLFEAICVGCVCTAGSAPLHPRLLIAWPLRGRSCCEGQTTGTRASLPASVVGGGGRREWRIPLARGAGPPRHFPPVVGLRVATGAMNRVLRGGHCSAGEALCAIWQTVNADGGVRLCFSVGNAAGWGCCVDPSHGFLFPSHGSADPSHEFCVPWALSGGKLGPICAIWWRKSRFEASQRRGFVAMCLNVRWF